MKAGIHSIRSELGNTNQRMQNLRTELMETIERTQVELQTVEVALDMQTREFRREIATIRSKVTNAKTHGTFNETRSQIEAIKRAFQAQLEAVEARAELAWHKERSHEGLSNKDGRRSRPGINLQVEPKKDGRLGRDIRCIRKAALV
jgi:septum formation inhibitor MinC